MSSGRPNQSFDAVHLTKATGERQNRSLSRGFTRAASEGKPEGSRFQFALLRSFAAKPVDTDHPRDFRFLRPFCKRFGNPVLIASLQKIILRNHATPVI
jgi:hypothetical protein